MSSITYHRKPNDVTYVYRQESYWDKVKKYSTSRQICIGKLGSDGEGIYNKRFSAPEAREALEKEGRVSESVLIGQSLVLAEATRETGLERVLRKIFEPDQADSLLSLAWGVAAGCGKMYLTSVWMEQNDCPAHEKALSSADISRILASVSQSQIDDFLREWTQHRRKGLREQDCFDLTSVSSHNASNPFVERGYNSDNEDLAQVNMALLTGVTSRIPTFYELHPGSMSDTKTIAGFIERMEKYGLGRIRMLLDRGFYSATNISHMLNEHLTFFIPVPTMVGWQVKMIDMYREAVEMPEHVIQISEDRREALYGMTLRDTIDGHRVWKHLNFDGARRTERIVSLFAALKRWEDEVLSGDAKENHKCAYKRFFTVKTTPKRGVKVMRKQEAINAYKKDHAGCWVILTNCEKTAQVSLEAYRERFLVDTQFDDLNNDHELSRLRTHGMNTMRGRGFVQFLAIVITARIRLVMADAWKGRMNFPKEDRLSQMFSLAEMMMRLGTYRKTTFSDRYGAVFSIPTKAQRSIFGFSDLSGFRGKDLWKKIAIT
jgi:transposase